MLPALAKSLGTRHAGEHKQKSKNIVQSDIVDAQERDYQEHTCTHSKSIVY